MTNYQNIFNDQSQSPAVFNPALALQISNFCKQNINLVIDRLSELKRRREIKRLLQCDDMQLVDMNLTLADVQAALSLPIGESAGKFLESARRTNPKRG